MEEYGPETFLRANKTLEKQLHVEEKQLRKVIFFSFFHIGSRGVYYVNSMTSLLCPYSLDIADILEMAGFYGSCV